MKLVEGTIVNPMLVGAIELMKDDPSDAHKQLFVTEMMKAVYLRPALVTPRPEPDEKGAVKLGPENRLQFPMLTAPDGKHFFMMFTDKTEYEKWEGRNNKELTLVQGNMEEACMMTLQKDSIASGAVINPFGNSVVVGKEMMMQLIAAKMGQLKEKK